MGMKLLRLKNRSLRCSTRTRTARIAHSIITSLLPAQMTVLWFANECATTAWLSELSHCGFAPLQSILCRRPFGECVEVTLLAFQRLCFPGGTGSPPQNSLVTLGLEPALVGCVRCCLNVGLGSLGAPGPMLCVCVAGGWLALVRALGPSLFYR